MPTRLYGRRARVCTLAAVALAALALSACQSNDAAGVLGAAEAQGDQAALRETVLGKGSTKIAMLLPLSAAGSTGEKGRKMRDAAQLAMSDLGNELITLTIEDTRGDASYAKELAVKAMGSGAKAVIGPTEQPAARQLATIKGTKRPLVFVLADNFAGAPGVYSVCLNEADSAGAGAAAVAAKGSRKFVLLVAQGPNAAALEKRVTNSLSIYGATLAVAVPFSPSGIEKAVADLAALVQAPEAIVIASGDASPAPVLAALKAGGMLGKGVAVVGTNRWLEHPLSDSSLQGAYIATLDDTETGPIAERFKSTYTYAADVHVAYAYDMVALSAGIASAIGPAGFKREIIENPTGFRGSTGLFRFRPDGASERAMPFYRIEKGALKLVDKSISSF